MENAADNWFLIVKGKVNKPLSVFCTCTLELACSNNITILPLTSGYVDALPKKKSS